jgi:hypothetical protein
MDDPQIAHSIKHQFLIEEYQALRREIEVMIKNVFWIFLTTLPIIGSIYLFFFQYPEKIIRREFFILPVMLVFILARVFFMMHKEIKDIAQYIREIERLLAPEGFGWETYLFERNKKRLNKKGAIWRFSYHYVTLYYLWWLVLLVGSTCMSYVLYTNSK